jgi:hypothetical protein
MGQNLLPIITSFLLPGLVDEVVTNNPEPRRKVKSFFARQVVVGVFALTALAFFFTGIYQLAAETTGIYAPWVTGGILSVVALLSYKFIR